MILRWSPGCSRGVMVAGVALTAGCGDMSGGAEAVETSKEPITGGQLLLSQTPPDTSAVKLEWTVAGVATIQCSAIKIASTVFWTAGHCAENMRQGVGIKITNNLSGSFSGSSFYNPAIAGVDVHPSYLNYTNMIPNGVALAHYDVARLTVSGVSPNIPTYSTTDSTWIGSNHSVTYTGYGCDAVDSSHSGRKQFDFFATSTLSAAQGVGLDTDYYSHNFVTVGASSEACEGDSGSPVFHEVNGAWPIIGITVNGGSGTTGFTRYSNVRKWLAAPAMNLFQSGFRGFIFNRWTGRCIAGSLSGGSRESYCDGRDQDFDTQSWRLADSGISGAFHLVNGSSGKCLDLETMLSGSLLVQRTCVTVSSTVNTQDWRFDTYSASGFADYRRLVNVHTGRCTAPSSTTSATPTLLTSVPCSSSEQSQAWMMTR